MILIFATFNTKATAVKIGKALLKQRLIACYNFWQVESAYWWKGKIEDDNETFMVLKTKEANFPKIDSYINQHSGYEVPEIVAVKATLVNQPYLDWISRETK